MDFGTSYSSWGYLFRDDFLVDPGDITTKDWGSENNISLKAPTCLLLTPDGGRVEAFGYEAEKFSELVREKKHKEYYYFNRFKMELHRLINKVRPPMNYPVYVKHEYIHGHKLRYFKLNS